METNHALGEDQAQDFKDEEMRFTGTQINYYFVCKRKLWLFTHNLELESESDLVHLGRLLHEQGYRRKFKEVQVDRIKVDFLEKKSSETNVGSIDAPRGPALSKVKNANSPIVIHEVKRSRALQDAHIFQLLYYIYYLKTLYKVDVNSGILHYPLLKNNVAVELTEEKRVALLEVMNSIKSTISLVNPPEAVRIRPCNSCAYRELCWS